MNRREMNHTEIAIVGGGPIGIEAALRAVRAGFSVQLFEREIIAANVRDWGHVKLFSPFGLNSSAIGREAVSETVKLPALDEILTGEEYARRYLIPLSDHPELRGSVRTRTKVVSIGRTQLWKRDLIGNSKRADHHFRLLLEDSEGNEQTATAKIVLDCSGVYPNSNWIGSGGNPSLGERRLLTHKQPLPDIAGSDRDQYANKTIVVIGSGYSAATAVVALSQLAEDFPTTKIYWITRSDRTPPITEIENDSLIERAKLTRRANQLALSPESVISWLPATVIDGISQTGDTGFTLTLSSNGSSRQLTVDEIIAHTGYRPDRTLTEELQIHECYASQGPMKLAASLLGETSADCLAQTSPGVETLKNPEPNFYILGAKSYGRDSRFLIKIGLEQIEHLFSSFAQQNRKEQPA